MAVNFHGMCETNVIKHNLTFNGCKLLRYFKPRRSRVYYHGNLPQHCFVTLAPEPMLKLFKVVTNTVFEFVTVSHFYHSPIFGGKQGTLTEGEGSVQLTSSLK
jgi:hypothetical protein